MVSFFCKGISVLLISEYYQTTITITLPYRVNSVSPIFAISTLLPLISISTIARYKHVAF